MVGKTAGGVVSRAGAVANRKPRRALVTLATGTHEELLDIALPTFRTFADAHGYDIIRARVDNDRPASWHKVPALAQALDDYDEALWIDADVVIVDASDDLDVPEDAWQALVRHHTGDGEVPNCGVWFVRRPMRRVLARLWSMRQHINAGWWEQEAMMELLGYSLHRPTELAQPGELYARTHWLDGGWNVHKWDRPVAERPRFMHASMFEDRAATMREWAGKSSRPFPTNSTPPVVIRR